MICPYIIGGWCYGRIVAHEMAYQLENEEEKVQHLFMLDSHVITDEAILKPVRSLKTFAKKVCWEL